MTDENSAPYDSWLKEGDAFYDAQRWNEAGAAYERALALHPAGSASLWYRLGNVREEQGRDEEALACFEKAVALEPQHARAWNNLGGARQRLGRPAAIDAYQRSIAADPDLAQPRLNLGRLHSGRGEHALAAECFRRALERHPGDPSFVHLAAAASGQATQRAPAAYVTKLFDGIAPTFEQHLVRDLAYHVPELLVQLALPSIRAAQPPVRAIDLGCGTGLIGAALAGSGVELTGIDLSSGMLQVAQKRGDYAHLQLGELTEALSAAAPRSVQAVFAADVFIYIGELDAVFADVARVLAPGGVFAFSVEGVDEGDYRLLPKGRYAHSPQYLRALAVRHGLVELSLARSALRREGASFADGWLALLTKA